MGILFFYNKSTSPCLRTLLMLKNQEEIFSINIRVYVDFQLMGYYYILNVYLCLSLQVSKLVSYIVTSYTPSSSVKIVITKYRSLPITLGTANAIQTLGSYAISSFCRKSCGTNIEESCSYSDGAYKRLLRNPFGVLFKLIYQLRPAVLPAVPQDKMYIKSIPVTNHINTIDQIIPKLGVILT